MGRKAGRVGYADQYFRIRTQYWPPRLGDYRRDSRSRRTGAAPYSDRQIYRPGRDRRNYDPGNKTQQRSFPLISDYDFRRRRNGLSGSPEHLGGDERPGCLSRRRRRLLKDRSLIAVQFFRRAPFDKARAIGAFVQLYADWRVRLFALIKLLKFLPKRESPVAHRRIVSGRVLAGPPQSFDAYHVFA